MAFASDDLAAFFEDRWAAGAVDRPIHSASAHQAGVRRIDNGVGGLLRDVTGLEENLRAFREV
jgi:hypothetical protein